ncbi:MAG: AMP-binding protein [Acidimicrobiales bacterium]|nr:AMP-binding protein [Acidimicrobiales bacterium]
MAEIIRKFADEKGDEVALVDDRGSVTWAELHATVNRAINAYRDAGLEPGDRIALLCGNQCENIEIQVAALHAGLYVVPVNWHWTGEELAYVVDDADAQALLVDGRFVDIALDAAERLGRTLPIQVVIDDHASDGFVTYAEWLAAASDAEPDDQRLGGPMFYTSGTTGFPKGVRTSATSPEYPAHVMSVVADGFLANLRIPEGGTTLLCGPLYHSAQWAWSMLPLFTGNRCVLQHSFDAADVLGLIDEHRVTNVHLVPTQFIRMLKLPDDVRASFDGSSLSCVWHGAAPCSPQVKRDVIDWFGPIVWEYYGGTEGGVLSVISSEEWLDRPGSVGQIAPGYEVVLLDDDGKPVPEGEAGQIWFRRESGADFEYHNAPEKTAAAHREGGYATLGDIGRFDDDGYLYLSDRKIDMIISGGVNIYPAEIEGVLVTHPAVRDAAVFGIPHDEMGEEVKAAVELADGHEPSDDLAGELVRHVRDHLAGYKAPRSVDFEDEFPRHPTGKLYKRLLRDRYWEGAGRTL